MPSDNTTRWAAEVRDLVTTLNLRLAQTPADVIVALDFDSLDTTTINDGERHVPQIDLDLLQRIPATKEKETLQ